MMVSLSVNHLHDWVKNSAHSFLHGTPASLKTDKVWLLCVTGYLAGINPKIKWECYFQDSNKQYVFFANFKYKHLSAS